MRAGVAAIALLLATPSAAQEGVWLRGFKTGNQLHADCQESLPRACLAYIQGSTDAILTTRIARQIMKQPVGPPCLSEGVTAGQLLDVVRAYLVAHPGDRHNDAYPMVLSALQEAFPCR